MKKFNSKVVIIGIGAVGSATAYAMANQGICNELVLVDLNADKAEGEAVDISHAMPVLGSMRVRVGGYEDCADADVILITGGANRREGETRLQLAGKNAAICGEIAENIMRHYGDGVILIATNPVDVIAGLVQLRTGLPTGKVIGSGTTLDSTRLCAELAARLSVDVASINAYVLGEHGDSQFISWDLTNISGIPAPEYFQIMGIPFDDQTKAEIAQIVRTGGGQVIKRKGFTNMGIAACLTDITRAILSDSNTILTVATMLNGLYGISDVAISVLSTINRQGVSHQIPAPLSPPEIAALQHSAEQVKAVLNSVR